MLQKLLASVTVLLSLPIAMACAEIVSVSELNDQSIVPTLNNAFGTLDVAVNFTSSSGTTLHQDITFSNVAVPSKNFGIWNGITVSGGDGSTWGSTNLAGDPWLSFAYCSNSGHGTINISGLDSSKMYQIEYMFGDNRTAYSPFRYNSIVVDNNGNTKSGLLEWAAVTNGTPSYALSTITVQNTTGVSYQLTKTGNGGFGIAGLVIRETSIPEPSSLVLATLGCVGLLAYAWRRRKP